MEKKTTAATKLAAKEKGMGGFLAKFSRKFAKITVAINTALMMAMFSAATAFANPSSGSGSSGSLDSNSGVESFNKIINFFAEWIGRIGLVVGFVGAIMFGLAIKNDDADAKTRGLMTLASGFVVFAVTKALDMFGITSSGTTGTTTAAIFLF